MPAADSPSAAAIQTPDPELTGAGTGDKVRFSAGLEAPTIRAWERL